MKIDHEIIFRLSEAKYLFLFIPILIVIFFLSTIYRKNKNKSYVSKKFSNDLIFARSIYLTNIKYLLWVIVWAFACIALMDPMIKFVEVTPNASNKIDAPVREDSHEIIFLIDVSASMGVPDGPSGESRLDFAKNMAIEMMTYLETQTISLYAFTSELISVVPPTLDYLFFRLSLSELHLNEGDVGGTHLEKILKHLNQEAFISAPVSYKTVVLFSDGGDNILEKADSESKEKEIEKILTTFSTIQKNSFSLFTIGIGKETPQEIPHVTYENKPVFSQLQPTILQSLAKQYDSKFYEADQWNSWSLAKEVMKQINQNQLKKNQLKIFENKQIMWTEDFYQNFKKVFQFPLFFVLILYGMNLLLPELSRKK